MLHPHTMQGEIDISGGLFSLRRTAAKEIMDMHVSRKFLLRRGRLRKEALIIEGEAGGKTTYYYYSGGATEEGPGGRDHSLSSSFRSFTSPSLTYTSSSK